jgi:hypothetical protein
LDRALIFTRHIQYRGPARVVGGGQGVGRAGRRAAAITNA